jgi:uncharacterized protein with HEPN domain
MSSRRPWSDRVRDILDALQEIEAFTAQLSFEQFHADLKTIRAVEMNLIVIGEAAAAIPEEVQEAHTSVPWHLMRGMRNRIVHAYFAVDERILWDTIQSNLPDLQKQLQRLIDEG